MMTTELTATSARAPSDLHWHCQAPHGGGLPSSTPHGHSGRLAEVGRGGGTRAGAWRSSSWRPWSPKTGQRGQRWPRPVHLCPSLRRLRLSLALRALWRLPGQWGPHQWGWWRRQRGRSRLLALIPTRSAGGLLALTAAPVAAALRPTALWAVAGAAAAVLVVVAVVEVVPAAAAVAPLRRGVPGQAAVVAAAMAAVVVAAAACAAATQMRGSRTSVATRASRCVAAGGPPPRL